MVNFNENEIINFYETKVKKDKYYISKYDKLSEDDILFIDSVFSTPMYKWYNRGYSRVRTILDFREWMKKHNIKIFDKRHQLHKSQLNYYPLIL